MIIKSIRSFFLLLAGFLFFTHMIIPHDHHMPVFSGQKEDCPSQHQKSDHRPLFPMHCHAFNDLAAEKCTQIIIKQEYQISFVAVIWHPVILTSVLFLPHGPQEDLLKPFQDISIPDFSPFRAPPCKG